MQPEPTHPQLIDYATVYACQNFECGPRLLREPKRRFGLKGEQPDLLCWRNASESFVVEVKASLSDFKADAKKAFRADPSKGVGVYRYYLVPKLMIEPHELPEGWGLLYQDGEATMEIRESERFHRRNLIHELALSLYAIGQQEDAGAFSGRGGSNGAMRIGSRQTGSKRPRRDPVLDAVASELADMEQAGSKQLVKRLGLPMTAARLAEQMDADARFTRPGPGGSWRLAPALKLTGTTD